MVMCQCFAIIPRSSDFQVLFSIRELKNRKLMNVTVLCQKHVYTFCIYIEGHSRMIHFKVCIQIEAPTDLTIHSNGCTCIIIFVWLYDCCNHFNCTCVYFNFLTSNWAIFSTLSSSDRTILTILTDTLSNVVALAVNIVKLKSIS